MAPTGYLSLPLELRQKILNDALADAADQDFALNINVRLFKMAMMATLYSTQDATPSRPSAPHLHDCASTIISVHPTIIDDVSFVLEQHLKTLERDWAQPSGWGLKLPKYASNSNLTGDYFVTWVSAEYRDKLHRWNALLKFQFPMSSCVEVKNMRARWVPLWSVFHSCCVFYQ
ncbi:hypothetical protein EG328_003425 [Venturia inaequalis]|uniref:Uncharacterized protein n=1 Tax=Venturia inaequalis TaxID=5025 RepID=A0A8H3UTU2_VENIN|nr:hypothetical protein EG328_003425 [Venturia inaequalis]RDI82483.1 hypothetical protein Vi05172_g7569 [Venturia inaequalis]